MAASWTPHPDTRELPPLRLTTRGCVGLALLLLLGLAVALVTGQQRTQPSPCTRLAAPGYLAQCEADLKDTRP